MHWLYPEFYSVIAKQCKKSNGNDKIDASHVVHTKSVNSNLKTCDGGEYKCCKSEPEKLSEQNSFENISKVTLFPSRIPLNCTLGANFFRFFLI